jgi:hypothetical protein
MQSGSAQKKKPSTTPYNSMIPTSIWDVSYLADFDRQVFMDDFDNKLPAEIRNRIYQYIIPEKEMPCYKMEIGFSDRFGRFGILDMGFSYLYEGLCTLSPQFKAEYGGLVVAFLEDHPLQVKFQFEHAAFEQDMQPTLARLCKPEDRTNRSHGRAVRYSRSWLGSLLAAAVDIMQMHPRKKSAALSLRDTIVADVVEDVVERIQAGQLNDEEGMPSTCLLTVVGTCATHAAMHLIVKQAIRATLYLPTYQCARLSSLIAVLHDLRYFADNNLADVSILIRTRSGSVDKWVDWIKKAGGKCVVEGGVMTESEECERDAVMNSGDF